MNRLRVRQHIRGSIAFIPLLLAVGILAALVVHQGRVSAIASLGPDPSEFSNTPVTYMLARDPDISSTRIAIPVYSSNGPSNRPNNVPLTIIHGRFCSNANNGNYWNYGYDRVYGSDPKPANGTVVATFTDGGGNTISGVASTNTTYCLADMTLNLNNWVYDGSTGYWIDIVTVNYVTSARLQNTFKVDIANPYLVGYSSGQNTASFAVSQNVTSGYHDYNLPFAPTCDYGTSSSVQYITLQDPDNGNSTIQPSRMHVHVVDVTPGMPSYNLNMAASVNGGGYVNVGTTYTPSSGNGDTDKIRFDVTGGHKYKLQITGSGVYWNNILQFKLPFDSINSLVTCYQYNLHPTTSVAGTTAQPGQSVPYTYRVQNDGIQTSTNIDWRVIRLVFPPSANPSAIGEVNDNGAGCNSAAYNGKTSCSGSPTPGSSGTQRFNTGSTTLPFSDSWTIPANATLGSYYCEILAVNPAAANVPGTITSTNRWSAPDCVQISINPMAYFSGSDVWAGAGFTGSCTDASAQIYTASNHVGVSGSLSSNEQLAAFATSSIRGFGSAGRYWMGSFHAPAAAPEDALFFANTIAPATPLDPSGQLGSVAHCMTDFYASAGLPNLPSTNLSSVPSGNYFVPGTSAQTLTLTASGQLSKRITISTPRKIVISSNITYSNAPVATIANLPRLIIAGNSDVTIDKAVSTITGIFEAKGVFYTCQTQPVTGQAPSCSTQLTINGAVIANTVGLRRTGGSIASPSRNAQAAEYFNGTPDAFLGAYSQGTGPSSLQVMQETELPPRY